LRRKQEEQQQQHHSFFFRQHPCGRTHLFHEQWTDWEALCSRQRPTLPIHLATYPGTKGVRSFYCDVFPVHKSSASKMLLLSRRIVLRVGSRRIRVWIDGIGKRFCDSSTSFVLSGNNCQSFSYPFFFNILSQIEAICVMMKPSWFLEFESPRFCNNWERRLPHCLAVRCRQVTVLPVTVCSTTLKP
jgi:hypothetical protein